MKLHHYIVSLLNIFFSFFNFFKKPQLRIITFHHIRKKNFYLLKKNIIRLKKKYTILDPDTFFQIISKKKKLQNNSILITFDDGFYSQKKFAKDVLSKLKIKSIFFIIPNFLKIKNLSSSKIFIKKNILKTVDIDNFDIYMRNMSFADLKYLSDQGHSIGMHTLNHKKLSIIKNNSILKNEIDSNFLFFKKILNLKKPFCFAYPFGNVNSINSKSIKIINKKYHYIFSGIRGNNFNSKSSNIFYRDALNDDDDYNLILGFMSGLVDFYYFKDKIKIKSMIFD